MVGVLLLVGHFYPGSSADLVDWAPTRSPEVEAQNEIDDIRQMMEAQNEIRRRRGVPEMTERGAAGERRRGRAAAAAGPRALRGRLGGASADRRLRLPRPRARWRAAGATAGRCAGPAAREEGLAAIEAAGIEPALADPERPGTILELVDDVAVLVLLLGWRRGQRRGARGDPRRRGWSGCWNTWSKRRCGASSTRGRRGRAPRIVRAAERTWRIPVAILPTPQTRTNRVVAVSPGANRGRCSRPANPNS